VTTIAALACAGSAFAADGTEHTRLSQCYSDPGLYTFCVDQDIVTNVTRNENNLSVFYHSDARNVFTGVGGQYAGCTQEFTSSYKSHILLHLEESGYQEIRVKEENSSVLVNCAGAPSMRCSFSDVYHVAHDAEQYVRLENFCEPV
jgi:hypothetical protein